MTYQIRIESHKSTRRRKPHIKIIPVECSYLAQVQERAKREQAEVEDSGRIVDRMKIEVREG